MTLDLALKSKSDVLAFLSRVNSYLSAKKLLPRPGRDGLELASSFPYRGGEASLNGTKCGGFRVMRLTGNDNRAGELKSQTQRIASA